MKNINKQIYLEDLPRHDKGSNNGKINWIASISEIVKFTYGEVIILNYNAKKKELTIKCNDKIQTTSIGSFTKCTCGILKPNETKYRYSLGEVIETKFSNIKIIKLTRVTVGKKKVIGYTYECLNDGYIGEMSETSLIRGAGCQVCSNRVIIKGINDIATTNPHLVKYFANIEDAYKYPIGSGIKVQLKCPYCGKLKNKLISICDLDNYGFSCDYCGDGVPYPEKFITNLLSQLDVKFIKEYKPKWARDIKIDNSSLSSDKIYDFYIPKLNCIIETHGSQHYIKSFTCSGARSLEDERENDEIKRELALKNGIKNYIVINSSESNLQWMKDNILNSELNYLLTLSNIEWEECAEFASGSLIKEVCKLYNQGIINQSEITNILGLGYRTINRYLNEGKELGLCDYDYKELKALKQNKKVLCITNGEVYNSLKEAGRILNISPKQISNCCNNYRKTVNGYEFKLI